MKNKNPKIGAEIGIQGGRMTIEVLKRLPTIETYYAIDPWLWYPDFRKIVNLKNQRKWNQKYMDDYYKHFKKTTSQFKNKIKVLKMTSSEAAQHIPDSSLDFCFIDGNHDYKYVKQDIKLYLPKVRKGGLFGGHDYSDIFSDVKKAVHESLDNVILGGNQTWWVWV
jgi:hypothetical protein